jgi:hypothetical protein
MDDKTVNTVIFYLGLNELMASMATAVVVLRGEGRARLVRAAG